MKIQVEGLFIALIICIKPRYLSLPNFFVCIYFALQNRCSEGTSQQGVSSTDTQIQE